MTTDPTVEQDQQRLGICGCFGRIRKPPDGPTYEPAHDHHSVLGDTSAEVSDCHSNS